MEDKCEYCNHTLVTVYDDVTGYGDKVNTHELACLNTKCPDTWRKCECGRELLHNGAEFETCVCQGDWWEVAA
jgi:hypothetical protein